MTAYSFSYLSEAQYESTRLSTPKPHFVEFASISELVRTKLRRYVLNSGCLISATLLKIKHCQFSVMHGRK